MKPIPKQYQEEVETSIYEIAQLVNKLWPFISELGDSIEIDCKSCNVKIIKRKV